MFNDWKERHYYTQRYAKVTTIAPFLSYMCLCANMSCVLCVYASLVRILCEGVLYEYDNNGYDVCMQQEKYLTNRTVTLHNQATHNYAK